ncbi:MAG TPA: hypothetical protein VFK03_03180, partial [Candidatus Saccharimonadales bacterium]|nr:hypothetical protein [Candidatus Saccharimonadales bacterium]
ATPPPDATAAAANNAAKLADAVNDLLDKPAVAPAAPSEKAPAAAPAPVDNDHVSVNGKKVIQPVNDLSAQGPKLDELLEEELDPSGVQPTPANTVITPGGGQAVTMPTTPPTTGAPDPTQPGNIIQPGAPDPHDVAL